MSQGFDSQSQGYNASSLWVLRHAGNPNFFSVAAAESENATQAPVLACVTPKFYQHIYLSQVASLING